MSDMVSVIVPVYNVEKYIEECLRSIQAQTYDNLEIIVIDDGSTDSSPLICDKYKNSDNRFKVFHCTNSGVSTARNIGITKSTGEWIMFLDADDYLDETAIEKLISIANEEDADVASCSFFYKFVNKCIPFQGSDTQQYYNSKNLFVHDMLIYPDKARAYDPTCLVPWGKIIRKNVIAKNQLKYSTELFLHEDALFNIQLFLKTNKKAVIYEPLVYYRQRNNSSSKSTTKDYFLNNKKFCMQLATVDQGTEALFTRDEMAFLSGKFFSYALTNLLQANDFKYSEARKQLDYYLNDTFYFEALAKLQSTNLEQYSIPKKLDITIKLAANRNTGALLFISWVIYIKKKVKGNNPFKSAELYS